MRLCPGASSVAVASREGVGVIGLKGGERRIEHFWARNHDHVEARRRLLSSEQLAGEALGSVPNDSRPELPCSGNAESTPGDPVGHDEERHEPSM